MNICYPCYLKNCKTINFKKENFFHHSRTVKKQEMVYKGWLNMYCVLEDILGEQIYPPRSKTIKIKHISSSSRPDQVLQDVNSPNHHPKSKHGREGSEQTPLT